MFGFGSMEMQLKSISGNIFNMMIFEKMKTGNQIMDTFITTLLLMSITYIFQFINNHKKG